MESDDERSLDGSFHRGAARGSPVRSPSGSMARKRRASVPAGVAAGTPNGSSNDLAALERDAATAAATAAEVSGDTEAFDASDRYSDAPQATWRRGDAMSMRAELADLACRRRHAGV